MTMTFRTKLLVGGALLIVAVGTTYYSISNKSSSPQAAVVTNNVNSNTQPALEFQLPKQTVQLPGGVIGFVIPQDSIDQYKNFSVVDETNNAVSLDATKQPIFVMDYWDSNADDILKAFSKYHVKMPVIVSSGLKNKVTLEQVVESTKKDLTSKGVTEAKVYYGTKISLPLVAVPTLLIPYHGQVVEVLGDIPDSSKWVELLGRA